MQLDSIYIVKRSKKYLVIYNEINIKIISVKIISINMIEQLKQECETKILL